MRLWTLRVRRRFPRKRWLSSPQPSGVFVASVFPKSYRLCVVFSFLFTLYPSIYCRRFTDSLSGEPQPSDEEVRFSTALSQGIYGLFGSLREHDKKELACELLRYMEKTEMLEKVFHSSVPSLALKEIADVLGSCILDCRGVGDG